MWFFVWVLDHFGRHFGSQNGDTFDSFQDFLRKVWNLWTCDFWQPFHVLARFWGSKGVKFQEKWVPRPLWNGLFFDWFLGAFLTYFGNHFGSFWEPKSSKNDGQKSHVKREDFHVTLWAQWGGRRQRKVGSCAPGCPPARAFPIDYSLLSIGFWGKWTISFIGYRSFIGYGHKPLIQHARRQEGRRINLC